MKRYLLVIKLFAPVPHIQLLDRPRVLKKFNNLVKGNIFTPIFAPVGFGKTSLVSWLEQTRAPTAWLPLDAADNEVGRFLLHLLTTFEHTGAKAREFDLL